MSPSRQAKSMGLKSLVQVTELTGVSKETLSNWSRDKPKLFKVVLTGCVEIAEEMEREIHAQQDAAEWREFFAKQTGSGTVSIRRPVPFEPRGE